MVVIADDERAPAAQISQPTNPTPTKAGSIAAKNFSEFGNGIGNPYDQCQSHRTVPSPHFVKQNFRLSIVRVIHIRPLRTRVGAGKVTYSNWRINPYTDYVYVSNCICQKIWSE